MSDLLALSYCIFRQLLMLPTYKLPIVAVWIKIKSQGPLKVKRRSFGQHLKIFNNEGWSNKNIRVYLHMVYSFTSSECYFIIFNWNESILQFKRLSNNTNVVFLKPVPIFGVWILLLQGGFSWKYVWIPFNTGRLSTFV